MRLPALPVVEALDPLREALAGHGSAVLVAPPGAGKTTVVPLALLDAGWLAGGRIVVLEPRRLAARAAARRMADLLGERVGDTVGYRVRRDTRVGPRTRIEVVTEGVLTRMLQSDPSLDGVGLVAFDEFHERSIHADLGLALALEARRLFRRDLRLLVMSATLDARPVAQLLGAEGDSAPLVETEGRVHPVDTRYLGRSPAPSVRDTVPGVTAQIERALTEEPGDVLAFLPGAGEIRRTAKRLATRPLPPSVDVYPLYGDLSRDEQDHAIAPSPDGRRKVVLATTIAQTSLTIEGVRVVVDSGWMRRPRFRAATGMTGLETLRVTADVADQRRGRAGRTEPGVCYRLWTAGEQHGLVPHLRPEILEADLTPLALELALWGTEAGALEWLDPPPGPAVEQASELLRQLDLVGGSGAITAHGRRVGELGLHPRLGHLLVRSHERGLAVLGCHLAALLSEGDLLRGAGAPPDADLRLRLEALRRGGRDTVAGWQVHRGRRGRVLTEARLLGRRLSLPRSAGLDDADIERAGEVLALAYPDRVARRRTGSPKAGATGGSRSAARYLLRGGRGAELVGEQGLAMRDWIVVSEVGDRGREARIFQAAPIELERLEELFAAQIEETARTTWDAEAGRVESIRERRLGSLVLTRTPNADAPAERILDAFLDGVGATGLDALPWSRSTRQLRDRLEFMHRADPDTWPDVREEELTASLSGWLGPFVDGMRRLDQLAGLDLAEVLWTHVGWRLRPTLDELAPTHLEVPSGSRLPIDYSDPAAPALAARLQELFGWRRTPRIAGGRVAITLRLLSPAQRPVQVTSDLASFWREGYFEVKKELKGRYPKHYWPEDPLTATATRRVRPK